MSETKTEQWYLVVGPFCWGKGKSISEARKKAKQNWSRTMAPKWKERVYEISEDGYVDDMGTVHAKKGKLINM